MTIAAAFFCEKNVSNSVYSYKLINGVYSLENMSNIFQMEIWLEKILVLVETYIHAKGSFATTSTN